jgi:hypothetical protein
MRSTILAIAAAAALTAAACSGKTVLSGDAWSDACPETEITLYPVVPEVLIMMDRSNSMTYDGFWEVTRDAVISMTEEYQDTIMIGLTVFPSMSCTTSNSDLDCLTETTPIVGVDFNTGAAISSTLLPMTTCGGTPVAETLLNMRDYLLGRPRENPRIIMVATDGAPNCNLGLNPNTCACTCFNGDDCALCYEQSFPANCLDDLRTYAALDALRSDGIKTYVIAMSWAAVNWGEVMQEMAGHGGTEDFYAAENPEDVQSMFDTITSLVSKCQFSIEPSEVADPWLVNLYLDGELLPMDPEGRTGWAWASETRIEFFGPPCNMIVAGTAGDIKATYGCPTFVLGE